MEVMKIKSYYAKTNTGNRWVENYPQIKSNSFQLKREGEEENIVESEWWL